MALTPQELDRLKFLLDQRAGSTANQSGTLGKLNDTTSGSVSDRLTAKQGAQGGTDTSFSQLAGNILPSAGRAVKGVYDAVAGLSPLGPKGENGSDFGFRLPPTVSGVTSLVAGAGEKLIPGKQGQEDTFDAVTTFFKDRYGSVDNLKQTVINDPTGVAIDISTLFSGGAGLASKAGLSKTASTLSTAAKLSDPISLTLQGASKVAKGATNLASKTAGTVASQTLGFTTGVGPEVIKEAFRNPGPEFTEALRGNKSKYDIVDSAKDALRNVESQKGMDYRQSLAKIGEIDKPIELSPLIKTLDQKLSDFNIKKNADGTLDFSRSTISEPAARNQVQGVVEAIQDWGNQVGDTLPIGVDILKRKLGDFYSDSSQARSIVSSLKNETSNLLKSQVPGYADMVKEYERASNFVTELENAVGIGGSKAVETSINKLTTALSENKEYRAALIGELEKAGNVKLKGSISGAALNSYLPRGLVGRLFAGGAAGLVSPSFLMGLALTLPVFSPRIVGEIVRGLGVSANKAKDVVEAVRIIKQKVPQSIKRVVNTKAGFQAGRVRDINDEVNQEASQPTDTGL